MKGDQLSYKRAVSVCLLGLGLQLLFGLTLLIYAVLAREHAAFTAAIYVLSGAIVWLSLTILFDQHRRERLEAMEAEALTAADARSASVFGESADDLRLAAKRLQWMHAYLLPGISLAMAALLIALGVWRFQSGKALVPPGKFQRISDNVDWLWPIGLGVAISVAGFLFARFVSGMAKQRVWANLRGGAAVAAGATVMALTLAVGHLIDYVGSDAMLRYLQVIFPVLMVALGAEILVSFLLNMYRPRRSGEIPRPAFDSRILAFLAAPDRVAESIGEAINYQFGFDVTSSWFYQLLSRSFVALIGLGLIVIWLMTSLAVVQPNELGLRIRNGRLVAQVGPGPQLKLPWPFERIERYPAQSLTRIDLASPPPKNDRAILWTNEHGVDEVYFAVQPGEGGGGLPTGDSRLATVPDLALVVAEVPLFFRVTDYEKFERFATPDTRANLIKAIAQREVFTFMATRRVHDMLGANRADASRDLRLAIQNRLESPDIDAGIDVVYAGLEAAHPPIDTAKHFEEVVASEQRRAGNLEFAQGKRIESLATAVGSVNLAEHILRELDRLETLNTAKADEEAIAVQEQLIQDLLTQAGGEAASLIRQAKADRWARHIDARARAERYHSQLVAYKASPKSYIARHYFDAMRDIMAESRVYIVADDGGVEVRVDLLDKEGGGNPFDTAAPKEE